MEYRSIYGKYFYTGHRRTDLDITCLIRMFLGPKNVQGKSIQIPLTQSGCNNINAKYEVNKKVCISHMKM